MEKDTDWYEFEDMDKGFFDSLTEPVSYGSLLTMAIIAGLFIGLLF